MDRHRPGQRRCCDRSVMCPAGLQQLKLPSKVDLLCNWCLSRGEVNRCIDAKRWNAAVSMHPPPALHTELPLSVLASAPCSPCRW